jgi:hypothetical protein
MRCPDKTSGDDKTARDKTSGDITAGDITVSPGIEPGYIVFPSHKNNVYMFSKVYCYFIGKENF